MRLAAIAALTLLTLSTAAEAEVFRCAKADGSTLFSDRPCGDQNQPYTPTRPIVIAPDHHAADLAERYDQRVEQGKQARDQADARWGRDYARSQAQQRRLDAARRDGRATAGMSAAEVRRLLGEPLFTSHSENAGVVREVWTYRYDGGARTLVRFKNGVVEQVSSRGVR